MKWSWKLAEFAGIAVYIHVTFLLVIGWIGTIYYLETRSLIGSLWGVAFVLSLFACVVLHEFGHALTARRYGIKTRDITLYPIGGVARLERMPEKPIEEFLVALAGPAVNVVIAAALFLILVATGNFEPVGQLQIGPGSFLEQVMIANIFLVVFNLLPAFPMDGGRVVRALLATRTSYANATSIAAGIGQSMAVLFGFAGLFLSPNPFLVVIAVFVWVGAAQEAGAARMKHALGGIPVIQAMLTDFRALSPRDSLQNAIDQILAGAQQDFPVVEEGRIVGILTRTDLMRGLSEGGKATPVREVMRKNFRTIHPYDMLDRALVDLQQDEARMFPVVHGPHLAGLLTMENVVEFLMIQSALQEARDRGLPMR